MRKNQSSDHGQAERTPRFRPRTKSQRDGQRAHERSHGGHHDGTETQQRTLIDGFLRRFAAVALFFERHVDHHDGIFLDDAHQHDDAHERVEIQIEMEDHQREQRSKTCGRQTGKNRDRVDEALIQNSQHQIDDQDRHQQQQP